MSQKCFLNVGGASKTIPVPPRYDGWRQDLLDIDPELKPEILADARDLIRQPAGVYDAVYCAHNLEHYYHHEAAIVLRGFYHVLKPDGFAEIAVPNLLALMKQVVAQNMDIDDVLYEVPAGKVLVRDVIYGFHVEIEKRRNDFYAHKTGFFPESLRRLIASCGFPVQAIAETAREIVAVAFKQSPPDPEHFALFGIKA